MDKLKNETFDLIPEINRLLVNTIGAPDLLHRSSPLYWCDNPMEILIATILTQATSDTNALKAWQNLKQLCPEPKMILDLEVPIFINAIKPAGLMIQRSKTIKEVLKSVNEQLGEYSLQKLAQDANQAWDFLNRLPGVGPKTAACTMLFGLGLPSFPVDTHINRVATRLGWVKSNAKPDETQKVLTKAIPPQYQVSLHILLLNLGRRFCHPKNPDCHNCPLFNSNHTICIQKIN